jgi:uncharacterized membrane protein
VRRLSRTAHELLITLWFVPLSCILVGCVLSLVTVAIDRHADHDLVSHRVTGTAADVHTILSTFASSMVTLTGLVLTMTLVLVQLAIGQFSPRIVRSLLEGHPSQLVIGLFGATFVQSVVALREIGQREPESVPGVSVLVAYGLMFASMVALVLYVHKIGRSLRVAELIDLVGDRARELVDELYERPPPRSREDGVVVSPDGGVVYKVERDALVAAAVAADCTLELLVPVGDFVPCGAPLIRVHGSPERLADDVGDLVALGRERTMGEDLPYAIRLLVDIALSGLAQPFSDPTTAVQALHRLHECLRELAPRDLDTGEYRDHGGRVRLVIPTLAWEGYVRLAFDEIRVAGAGSPQVPRRLRAAIEDLKRVAAPERQAALDRQLELLDAAVRSELDDREAALALVADHQGIGSGRDVLQAAASQARDGGRP